MWYYNRGEIVAKKNQKPGTGKTQKFEIEKQGLEKFVMEKYKENVPATKISSLIKSEHDIYITPLAINRWLKKVKERDMGNIAKNNAKELQDVAVDYKREIYDILEEVKEMKKYAKDEKHLDGYVKLVGKLYQGLELLAKILGDMQQGQSVDINVIINRITENEQHRNSKKRSGLFDNNVFDVDAEVVSDEKSEEGDD